MNAQPTLFPVGRARSSDPDTSRAAAQGISGRTERLILDYFRTSSWNGLNDDELAEVFDRLHAPTVKSARSRLSKAGLLVDSGLRRPSNRGRAQVVWTLAP